MDYKTYDSKMSGMLDKIGTEASNLILDDVALMLSDNQKMNEEMKQKNEEIEKLKSLNSRLQEVNGNLLLQIPTIKKVEDEEQPMKKHSFNYKDVFDEKGNFKT